MGSKVAGKENLKLVTVHLPRSYIRMLDSLVREGLYSSRSEAIRIAVRDLIKKEMWYIINSSKPEVIIG